MHPNATLLTRLFTALNDHDAAAMSACYCEDAQFHDIAFDLHGQQEVRAMWTMICKTDIKATFEVVEADNKSGRVKLIDDYTFRDTGRRVHNVIDSRFTFRDGLIATHMDELARGGIR